MTRGGQMCLMRNCVLWLLTDAVIADGVILNGAAFQAQ
jgi:hypothetical protein